MTGHRSFDEEAKNNCYDPSNRPKAVLVVLVTFALTYFTRRYGLLACNSKYQLDL